MTGDAEIIYLADRQHVEEGVRTPAGPRPWTCNRPQPHSPLTDARDAWLFELGAGKLSPATLRAYGTDIRRLGQVIAEIADVAEVTVSDLDRSTIRQAFAVWSVNHSAASMRRYFSVWDLFCAWLVGEGALPANPMFGLRKAKAPALMPRSIRARDAIPRLLAAAAESERPARGKLDRLFFPPGSSDLAGLTGEVAREAGQPET